MVDILNLLSFSTKYISQAFVLSEQFREFVWSYRIRQKMENETIFISLSTLKMLVSLFSPSKHTLNQSEISMSLSSSIVNKAKQNNILIFAWTTWLTFKNNRDERNEIINRKFSLEFKWSQHVSVHQMNSEVFLLMTSDGTLALYVNLH